MSTIQIKKTSVKIASHSKMNVLKFLLQLFLILNITAGWSQYIEEKSNRLIGTALNGQPTLSITDSKFSELNKSNSNESKLSDFTSINSAINIHIGLDESAYGIGETSSSTSVKSQFNVSYKAIVKLEIKRYANSGVLSNNVQNTEIKEFVITHNKTTENLKHNDFVVYKLAGTHKAEIKVLSVMYTNLDDKPITLTSPSNVFVELIFSTERYFNIKDTAVKPNASLVTYKGFQEEITLLDKAKGEHEIQISWNKDPNFPAVEYELEWTWIDNYGEGSEPKLPNNIPFTEEDFKRNSSRIQTKELSYRIPLIFSKGYLLYRVRPVGRFLDDVSKIYFGKWSTTNAEKFQNLSDWQDKIEIVVPHEKDSKNWQYQSSFAEDGKKKEVVSYFDGSLRNRQTVTKVNTNNQSIVGEVIYDNQGRPAIEVLPVPLENSAIKYFDSLNKNQTTVFSHLDFDWDDPKKTDCSVSTSNKMNTSSGASNYYSAAAKVSNNFQDYVPDAKGFPYSQIVYTPDNTGRIYKKGGVGSDHQIGRGHEMTYLYSTPSQEELNRIFGYKVGFANKYKKNTVIDPNGQASVSYIDPKGKTIATALVGQSPENLDALPELATEGNLKTDLLVNNKKKSSGRFGILKDGIDLTSKLEVVGNLPSTIKFDYGLEHSKNTFQPNCLTNKSYPFVYDLKISLKDDCANERLNFEGNPIKTIGSVNTQNPKGNLPLIAYNTQKLEAKNLSQGSYLLSKELVVNKDALDAYAEDYLYEISKQDNICNPKTELFNVQIDVNGCEITCGLCEKTLVENYLKENQKIEFSNCFDKNNNKTCSEPIFDQYAAIAKYGYVLDKLNTRYAPTIFTYDTLGKLNYQDLSLNPIIINNDENLFKKEFDFSLQTCRDLCPKMVTSCHIMETTLLSDLSPNGQYGSIKGIIFKPDMDDSTTDIVINASNPDSNTSTNTNTNTPDPSNNTIQVVNDDLSVFNEYNYLLRGGSYPIGKDAYGDNKTVTKEQSQFSWKYPSDGVYKNADGSIAWVTVKKIAENTYLPPIEPNTPLLPENITDTDILSVTSNYRLGGMKKGDNEDEYLVSPQYLDNIADFIKNWKQNWAKSLLAYHPEYYYYEYNKALCENTLIKYGNNTDNYDLALNEIETYKIASQNKQLIENPSSATGIKILEEDPFYNLNYNKVESTTQSSLRKNLIIEALTENYEGMTYKYQGQDYKMNMFQAAAYTVLFGNGLAPISIFHNVKNNSALINYINNNVNEKQKDRIWLTYKNYYTSFKNKIKTVFSNIYSIKNKGYNGYIGNINNTEKFRYTLRKYAKTYNTIAKEIDERNPFTPFSDAIDNLKKVYKTSYVSVYPQNILAIDNSDVRIFYKDKQKRFIDSDYFYDSGASDDQNLDSSITAANNSLYLETKKCPLLLDMQSFLNGLIQKDYNPIGKLPTYNTEEIPANTIAQLTNKLYESLGAGTLIKDLTSIPKIKGYIVSNTVLDLKIEDENASNKKIKLEIINPTSYITSCPTVRGTSASAPDWSMYGNQFYITEFKDIYAVPGGEKKNYKFKIIAKADFDPDPLKTCFEEILIEGTTEVPLDTCTEDGTINVNGQATIDATAGCTNKMYFERNLLQIINKLISEKTVNSTTGIRLNTGYNSTQSPPASGIYPYANNFIQQFLNDTQFAAQYKKTIDGFQFILPTTGQVLINVTDLQGNLPTDRITSIKIDNSYNIQFFSINNNGIISSVKGKLATKDFQCICTKKLSIKEIAEANLLKLINHLWSTQKNNKGQLPNNNASYNPKEWQEVDPYIIPNGSTIDNFKTEWITPKNSQFSSKVQGMQYNFANCDFSLILSYLNSGNYETHRNYFNAITHFSNFKLNTDNKTFTVWAHNNPYESVPTYSYQYKGTSMEMEPAGYKIITGSIDCLEFCKEKIDVETNLTKLLNIALDEKYLYEEGYKSPENISPNSLLALPLTLPVENRVISNWVLNRNELSFAFGKNSSCGVNLEIIDLYLDSNYSNRYLYDLIFDDDTYTTFKIKIGYIYNFQRIKKEAYLEKRYLRGKISCLKLPPSCTKEEEVPCVKCVPQQVEPLACGSKWKEYVEGMKEKLPNYTLPEYLAANDEYFCNAKFAYITTPYLYYLKKFFISDVTNYKYISIAEFGATKLNYGYKDLISAIDSYALYISSNDYSMSWNNYINNVYVVENQVCPPAPMVPDLKFTVNETKTPCEIFHESITKTYTNVLASQEKALKKEEFVTNYIKEAIDHLKETFTKEAKDQEYQYTLYYYDQAGNLTQTIPPKGVSRLGITKDNDPLNININNFREKNDTPENASQTAIEANHSFNTEYKYNSLNQLVWQKTPDGGETRFAYDALGRIIASQNANQKKSITCSNGICTAFSFTKYDGLGRIYQAGEIIAPSSFTIDENGRLLKSGIAINNFEQDNESLYLKQQVTHTLYDEQHPDALKYIGKSHEDNNQKRVTAVLYIDKASTLVDINKYDNAIFYDYDIHGNVRQFVQRNTSPNLINLQQDAKKVVYDYDLISGKVNKVIYQPGQKDQFIHKYAYDADNRIVEVQTSTDDIIWEKDAKYEYYQHGPLARTIIGDKTVQGLDYIYTLQGWLKAVNSEQIGHDIGHDGSLNGTNAVGQDAIAFALNYYSGDYLSRQNTKSVLDTNTFSLSQGMNLQTNKNLYNGNIKEMVTSLLDENQVKLNSQFNKYTYDQLNRIKTMNSIGINSLNQTHESLSSQYQYDSNGNLFTLKRTAPVKKTDNNITQKDYNLMDDFSYHYIPGTNKLAYIDDTVPNKTFTNDPNNPNDTTLDLDDQNPDNYKYDAIGQLIRDEKEGITIDWRVDGKVKKVSKDNGTIITFDYDGLGNRIAKTISRPNEKNNTTYYQRDAQGNVMAVYEANEKNTIVTEPVVPNLYLNDYIVSGTEIKKASKGIYVSSSSNSISTVKSTGNLTLQASNEIVLSNGFSTETNAKFLAEIKPINTPVDTKSGTFRLVEHDIYGSSRLGVQNADLDLSSTNQTIKNKLAKKEWSNLEKTAPFGLVTSKIKGIELKTIKDSKTWQSPSEYGLNFFPDAGVINDSIVLKTNIKISQNTPEKGLLLSLHNHLSKRDWIDAGPYYRSSAFMFIEKIRKSTNPDVFVYKPVVKLVLHKRDYGVYSTRSGGKRNKFDAYVQTIDYTIPTEIPENQWNLKVNINKNGNNQFDVKINVNGNIYKANKVDSGLNWSFGYGNIEPHEQHLINFPTLPNNALGANYLAFYDPNNNYQDWSLGSAHAEICDFTYSIDEIKHQFSFDETPTSVSTDMLDKDNIVKPLTITNLTSKDYSDTYCGPQALDTDQDGVLDFKEDGKQRLDNCRFTFNPDQKDSDGDGYGDVCDNCQKNNPTPNPINPDYQLDTDGDGVGDDCDNCKNKYNPRIDYVTIDPKDQQALAIRDANPTYLSLTNQYQSDRDEDGFGDGCDNCIDTKNGKSEGQTDANGNQLDADQDGIGDICEGIDQGKSISEIERPANEAYRLVGDKNYELSNHLGNVLSVITDRKLFIGNSGNNFTFMPDVLSYNDYYPFGSLIPNRHGSTDSYRYGFNGMEKDDELKGEGNSYDFGARMLDPRVGRWFAPDKLEGQYPSYSTYNYTLNNPIYFIDPNGKGPFDWYKNKYGNYVYDKNVKSQADVGDKGTYKGDVVVLNQQTSNGQWMNTFQLNADGSVVDSFGKNYMDNFGEFTIGSSGVKVINEHTFEEKWEEYVTDNLYRASDWIHSIESDKLFKSSNTGIKIGFEFNKYSWESQVGIYSSSENSAGFYNTNEFAINGKLSTDGFNISNYVPTPTLQFIAKLNTTNPFEPSKFVNENKVKSTASGKIPGMPFHVTYEFEGNITTGTVNQSIGVDAGIGSGNKIENGVSNTTSNTNVTKEAKFD
ncbi:RHS repeat-associated core domain-containing protein [Flavobacterium columnare]|uniref:RHS repeat-associated core domain-containing protein n=2 Tax=Flavobacterium columnare TaxID=996 RepID=UPI0018968B01|nr:RHS repeat-associated core domain-containing protein [Flavobacterium columnare]MBF6657303.1 hypothetical protein [Flavobacterium columnare]